MVILHRTIRRLKDTFQYTPPYDEIRQPEQIIGRRLLSTKKLSFLPISCENHYDVNYNEICVSPSGFSSLGIGEQRITNDRYGIQQSKLKNMVIDELKSFFLSRSQSENRNSDLSTHCAKAISIRQDPAEQTNQIHSVLPKKLNLQHNIDRKQIIANRKQFIKSVFNSKGILSLAPSLIATSTMILASISLLTNILIRSSKRLSIILNLLSDILFYSTSFTFGCFGAHSIQRTKLSSIHRFSHILTRNLFLHTCLTLLIDDRSFSQKQRIFSTSNRFKRSMLHLIAGFLISFDNQTLV